MFDYRAQLHRVIDGDTLVLTLDQGFSGRQEEAIRLVGVSAPELAEPGGQECLAFTLGWLGGAATLRWPLYVTTVPNTNPEPTERRTLVRYLGAVQYYDRRDRVLNTELATFLAQHPEWGHGE